MTGSQLLLLGVTIVGWCWISPQRRHHAFRNLLSASFYCDDEGCSNLLASNESRKQSPLCLIRTLRTSSQVLKYSRITVHPTNGDTLPYLKTLGIARRTSARLGEPHLPRHPFARYKCDLFPCFPFYFIDATYLRIKIKEFVLSNTDFAPCEGAGRRILSRDHYKICEKLIKLAMRMSGGMNGH